MKTAKKTICLLLALLLATAVLPVSFAAETDARRRFV